MPLIELTAVSLGYDVGTPTAREVLKGIDLRLEEDRIGVIGANGSGKSSFARLLNALIVPTEGTVRIDGLDTRRDARAVRRKVAFTFTDPDAQIVMPTVAEDIAFGLRRRRLAKEEVAARVEDALERFGLVGHRDHPAHLLSGGQKQMLAIAAVLVTRPEILVMDEPTTLLDLANTRLVSETIARLDEQVIVVTHDLDLLTDFDRVLVFADGRIVHDGAPDASISRYRQLHVSPR